MQSVKEIERRLRRLRQAVCSTDDPLEECRLGNMIEQAKKELSQAKSNNPEPVGTFSGLTRRELASTGTCETDWF